MSLDHNSIISQKSIYFRLPDSIITTDHYIGAENTRSGRINKENTVPSFILLQANTPWSSKSLNTHGHSLYIHLRI